jgi:hypothetical protein
MCLRRSQDGQISGAKVPQKLKLVVRKYCKTCTRSSCISVLSCPLAPRLICPRVKLVVPKYRYCSTVKTYKTCTRTSGNPSSLGDALLFPPPLALPPLLPLPSSAPLSSSSTTPQSPRMAQLDTDFCARIDEPRVFEMRQRGAEGSMLINLGGIFCSKSAAITSSAD